MNEEQKEKWYKSFTREQLIERCEYLQRSCERKENSIMELEMENADLEKGYCELKEKCDKGECDCTHEEYNSMCETNIKLENEIERLKTKYVYKPKIKFREVLKLREEIERQKEIIRQLDIKNLELTSIIKEVREKIRNVQISYLGLRSGKIFTTRLLMDILEILDKVGSDKE